MAKFAVNIKEILSHTVFVDNVESYEEAEAKVQKAYNDCDIVLDADNSSVYTEFKDDTSNFLEFCTEEEFNEYEAYKFKEG